MGTVARRGHTRPHRALPLCRAQALLALLKDGPRLAAEREAHARKRGAYQGFSSYDMQAQGGPAGQHGAGEASGWHASAQVRGPIRSIRRGRMQCKRIISASSTSASQLEDGPWLLHLLLPAACLPAPHFKPQPRLFSPGNLFLPGQWPPLPGGRAARRPRLPPAGRSRRVAAQCGRDQGREVRASWGKSRGARLG